MENKILLEAKSEKGFPFQFFIEKAVALEEAGEMVIQGVATSANIDHDNERMAPEAILKMENIINTEGVPLRLEHQKDASAIIGTVFKAWRDDRNQLWIKASMDKSHAMAGIIYKSVKEGAKLGLSIGGRVKKALKELSESTGRLVQTFYDVILDEVSVTNRPANYDAWLVAKSYIKSPEESKKYESGPLLRQFLFENPQLDYLQSFAKSIPDNAWQKVEKEQIKNMKDTETKPVPDTTETKEKARDEKETDFVSTKAFKSFSDSVAKGFETLTAMLAKMQKATSSSSTDDEKDETKEKANTSADAKPASDPGAHDQNNPDKDTDADPQRKTDVPDKTHTVKPAMDQTNPDKKKPTAGTDMTKDGHDESETVGTQHGTPEGEHTDKTDGKEYGDEYKLPDLQRAMKKMTELAKSLETETVSKSKKSELTMDVFVKAITDVVTTIITRLEKNGKQVLGIEKMLIDTIRQDEEIQKSFKELMNKPGSKQSVALGVPMMRNKDGQLFALSAAPLNKVEKSEMKDGVGFKEAYKARWSTQGDQRQ